MKQLWTQARRSLKMLAKHFLCCSFVAKYDSFVAKCWMQLLHIEINIRSQILLFLNSKRLILNMGLWNHSSYLWVFLYHDLYLRARDYESIKIWGSASHSVEVHPMLHRECLWGSKSSCTHISENHLGTSFALFYWSDMATNGSEGPILNPKWPKMNILGQIWPFLEQNS